MSAIISECGTYRYRLERELGLLGRPGAFVMINPSTADAHCDDPTIRRIMGFGRQFGWSKVIVGNLFAFRTPNVRLLGQVHDPIGPLNAQHLAAILSDSGSVVVAWGPNTKLPKLLQAEWKRFVALATAQKKDLFCLGLANDGHPRHPLMLRRDSNLSRWIPPTP